MKFKSIAIFLAVAVTLSAQTTYTATLPKGFDTLDGNYATSAPLNSTSPQLWQFGYDWTQFTHQCPITITQIDLRRSSGAAFVGATLQNVTIAMCTSNRKHNLLSTTFATNRGSDYTVVYTGTIVIPPFAGTTLSPGQPAPWFVTVPLQTPFEFDPTQKTDFLLEITTAGPLSAASGFILDGQFPTAWGGRNGHASSATSTVANTANGDAVVIVNLHYTLGASTKFDLTALTSGAGVGDLLLAMNNVPATTAIGFTLISTTPMPTLGLGPAFGLAFDPLLVSIITTPPSLGNPLAWTYPTAPPGVFFPDAVIALPPGAASFLAGQTWDLCGVAFNAATQVVGITAPRRLVW